jgi:hypothetical protein
MVCAWQMSFKILTDTKKITRIVTDIIHSFFVLSMLTMWSKNIAMENI